MYEEQNFKGLRGAKNLVSSEIGGENFGSRRQQGDTDERGCEMERRQVRACSLH